MSRWLKVGVYPKNQCNTILKELLKHKFLEISLQNSAYTTYEVIHNPYQ